LKIGLSHRDRKEIMENFCFYCEFWKLQAYSVLTEGSCHKNSPSRLWEAWIYRESEEAQLVPKSEWSMWPTTYSDDFCGEFKQADSKSLQERNEDLDEMKKEEEKIAKENREEHQKKLREEFKIVAGKKFPGWIINKYGEEKAKPKIELLTKWLNGQSIKDDPEIEDFMIIIREFETENRGHIGNAQG
jgi:hypothetical protein